MSSYIVYIPCNKSELCKLFDENKLTEDTMSFNEFQNIFNPSVNAKDRTKITNSLVCYQETTKKITQTHKYEDFIKSKARAEFCSDHGNNYRGPSNLLLEYEIKCKIKYPLESFNED